MNVGEAIKLLEDNNFSKINHVGSHIKYKRGNDTITIVFHCSKKESVHPRTVNLINSFISKTK